LQKRAEAEVQKASNSSDNTVLDRARMMYSTNSGAKKDRMTKSLMIGLALSFVFVLLLKVLNSKITTISEAEKASKFPVIGSIRRTKKRDPMLLIRHPNSAFAETFRVIRTRMEFIVQRRSNIMITISSAESGDGKTYFSANLAAVYAVTGSKTILVDMDIRKPNIHKSFDVNYEPGVTNYLIGEMSLKEVIKKTENEYYDILTTGPIPPNPGEIVRSNKLKEMFEELKKEYEYIIIDTSPIGLVADAYAIMLISDLSLFVTRLNKTRKQNIKKVSEQLREDKVQHVYTIINDVIMERSHYSKYNAYGYGYGYGVKKFYSKKKREAAETHARYYSGDVDI
jgi:capsular exopolysaccharide synthesis family protein